MSIFEGSLVTLKIGNGSTPTETFTQVGGLENVKMRVRSRMVESSNLSTGRWRELISGAGVVSLSISASGKFGDATSEETLRNAAFANTLKNYEFVFGNGDKVSGAFQISDYERFGDMESEEGFSVALESGGDITYTPA